MERRVSGVGPARITSQGSNIAFEVWDRRETPRYFAAGARGIDLNQPYDTHILANVQWTVTYDHHDQIYAVEFDVPSRED